MNERNKKRLKPSKTNNLPNKGCSKTDEKKSKGPKTSKWW